MYSKFDLNKTNEIGNDKMLGYTTNGVVKRRSVEGNLAHPAKKQRKYEHGDLGEPSESGSQNQPRTFVSHSCKTTNGASFPNVMQNQLDEVKFNQNDGCVPCRPREVVAVDNARECVPYQPYIENNQNGIGVSRQPEKVQSEPKKFVRYQPEKSVTSVPSRNPPNEKDISKVGANHFTESILTRQEKVVTSESKKCVRYQPGKLVSTSLSDGTTISQKMQCNQSEVSDPPRKISSNEPKKFVPYQPGKAVPNLTKSIPNITKKIAPNETKKSVPSYHLEEKPCFQETTKAFTDSKDSALITPKKLSPNGLKKFVPYQSRTPVPDHIKDKSIMQDATKTVTEFSKPVPNMPENSTPSKLKKFIPYQTGKPVPNHLERNSVSQGRIYAMKAVTKSTKSVPTCNTPEKIVPSEQKKFVPFQPKTPVHLVGKPILEDATNAVANSTKSICNSSEKTVRSEQKKFVPYQPDKPVPNHHEGKSVLQDAKKAVTNSTDTPQKIVPSGPKRFVPFQPKTPVSNHLIGKPNLLDAAKFIPNSADKIPNMSKKIATNEAKKFVPYQPQKPLAINHLVGKSALQETMKSATSSSKSVLNSPEKIATSEQKKFVPYQQGKIYAMKTVTKSIGSVPTCNIPGKIVPYGQKKFVDCTKSICNSSEKAVPSKPKKFVPYQLEKPVPNHLEGKSVLQDAMKPVPNSTSSVQKKTAPNEQKFLTYQPERLVHNPLERKPTSKSVQNILEKNAKSEHKKIVSHQLGKSVPNCPEGKSVLQEKVRPVPNATFILPKKTATSEPKKFVPFQPRTCKPVSSESVNNIPERIVPIEPKKYVPFQPQKPSTKNGDKISTLLASTNQLDRKSILQETMKSVTNSKSVPSTPEKIATSEPKKFVPYQPQNELDGKSVLQETMKSATNSSKSVQNIPEKIARRSEDKKFVPYQQGESVTNQLDGKSILPNTRAVSNCTESVPNILERIASNGTKKSVPYQPDKPVANHLEGKSVLKETAKAETNFTESVLNVSEKIVQNNHKQFVPYQLVKPVPNHLNGKSMLQETAKAVSNSAESVLNNPEKMATIEPKKCVSYQTVKPCQESKPDMQETFKVVTDNSMEYVSNPSKNFVSSDANQFIPYQSEKPVPNDLEGKPGLQNPMKAVTHSTKSVPNTPDKIVPSGPKKLVSYQPGMPVPNHSVGKTILQKTMIADDNSINSLPNKIPEKIVPSELKKHVPYQSGKYVLNCLKGKSIVQDAMKAIQSNTSRKNVKNEAKKFASYQIGKSPSSLLVEKSVLNDVKYTVSSQSTKSIPDHLDKTAFNELKKSLPNLPYEKAISMEPKPIQFKESNLSTPDCRGKMEFCDEPKKFLCYQPGKPIPKPAEKNKLVPNAVSENIVSSQSAQVLVNNAKKVASSELKKVDPYCFHPYKYSQKPSSDHQPKKIIPPKLVLYAPEKVVSDQTKKSSAQDQNSLRNQVEGFIPSQLAETAHTCKQSANNKSNGDQTTLPNQHNTPMSTRSGYLQTSTCMSENFTPEQSRKYVSYRPEKVGLGKSSKFVPYPVHKVTSDEPRKSVTNHTRNCQSHINQPIKLILRQPDQDMSVQQRTWVSYLYDDRTEKSVPNKPVKTVHHQAGDLLSSLARKVVADQQGFFMSNHSRTECQIEKSVTNETMTHVSNQAGDLLSSLARKVVADQQGDFTSNHPLCMKGSEGHQLPNQNKPIPFLPNQTRLEVDSSASDQQQSHHQEHNYIELDHNYETTTPVKIQNKEYGLVLNKEPLQPRAQIKIYQNTTQGVTDKSTPPTHHQPTKHDSNKQLVVDATNYGKCPIPSESKDTLKATTSRFGAASLLNKAKIFVPDQLTSSMPKLNFDKMTATSKPVTKASHLPMIALSKTLNRDVKIDMDLIQDKDIPNKVARKGSEHPGQTSPCIKVHRAPIEKNQQQEIKQRSKILPAPKDLTDQVWDALIERTPKKLHPKKTSRCTSMQMIKQKSPDSKVLSKPLEITERVGNISVQMKQKYSCSKFVVKQLTNISLQKIKPETLGPKDLSAKINVERNGDNVTLPELRQKSSDCKDQSPSKKSTDESKNVAGTSSAHKSTSYLDQIPPIPTTAEPKLKTQNVSQDDVIIFFDLETTGLEPEADILQIGAISQSTQDTFDTFVLPKKQSHMSTNLYGFAVKTEDDQKKVFYKEEEVDALPVEEALGKFFEWIKKQTNECGVSKRSILCGHNARAFDMRILIRHVQDADMQQEFLATIGSFMDTLPAFRKLYPNLKDTCKYSQETLYAEFVGGTYDGHNAINDVKALKELFKTAEFPSKILSNHNFTAASCWENVLYTDDVNPKAFWIKINIKGVTKWIAQKAAKSGLEYNHLRLAFEEGGPEGLRAVLMEKKAPHYYNSRVTDKEEILNLFFQHFKLELERKAAEKSHAKTKSISKPLKSKPKSIMQSSSDSSSSDSDSNSNYDGDLDSDSDSDAESESLLKL